MEMIVTSDSTALIEMNSDASTGRSTPIKLFAGRLVGASFGPAQMETADMVSDNAGIWLYHCHISDHMAGGMVTRYEVKQ